MPQKISSFQLWKVVNVLVALLMLVVVAKLISELITANTLQTYIILPFIIVESIQIVLLFMAASPKYVSESPIEFIVACICTLLPVYASGYFGSHLVRGRFESLIIAGDALTIVAQIAIIWSLANIRTSFSILPEARKLCVSGLYRYVRHPIYTSYFVWYFGSILIVQDPIYTLIMIGAIMLQVLRAKFEDKKLAQLGRDAKQYQKQTGMFLPKNCKLTIR